jgi:hypothetical protein
MFNRGFEEDELSLPRVPNGMHLNFIFHRGETCLYSFNWGEFNWGPLPLIDPRMHRNLCMDAHFSVHSCFYFLALTFSIQPNSSLCILL